MKNNAVTGRRAWAGGCLSWEGHGKGYARLALTGSSCRVDVRRVMRDIGGRAGRCQCAGDR